MATDHLLLSGTGGTLSNRFLAILFLGFCFPVAADAATWEADWNRVLQAAKREGKIAMVGPTGADRRDALTIPFQQKYGIAVEYWADPVSGVPPRVAAERRAGKYLWDVIVAGAIEDVILPMGVLEPLEPALILPDIKDPKLLRGGEMEFLDPGRQVLVMSPFHRGTLFVNTELVKPAEFKSYRDLLDPKWRGKIVIDDPRRNGPGQATFSFFYAHPKLGPEFIRALARQELQVLRDYGQEIDALGRGKVPIVIGTSDSLVEERMKQGIPIAIVDPRQLQEGSDVGAASGMVALFNNAPDPNAARVYLNWLLSKEGQTHFVRATGYVSNRLDVPADHAAAWRVPQPGAVKTYGIAVRRDIRAKVVPLVQEIFGK
jgi:ABC-type Fe3+ transport system substrate-binding protein